MPQKTNLHKLWLLRRPQSGGSAAFATGTAMAIPIGILLAGTSMAGLSLTNGVGPLALVACVTILTLLFPLVLVTLNAIQKLDEAVAQIKKSIKFDGLTRVLSRAYFLDLIRDSKADGFILMIDADHFKRINDTYGHGSGDAALVEFAQCIERSVGSFGYVGRLGGEEFGVFLPNIQRAQAEHVAEDIRRRIEHHAIFIEGADLSLTGSIGAGYHMSGAPVRTSLTTADVNLFRAKELGRNMVIFDVIIPSNDGALNRLYAVH